MRALTIYETLKIESVKEFKSISIENTRIRDYFFAIFNFLIKEIPPVNASEFLEEYEEEIIDFYTHGLNVYDAAIKLRQSYEQFLHRFDEILTKN